MSIPIIGILALFVGVRLYFKTPKNQGLKLFLSLGLIGLGGILTTAGI